MSIHNSRYMRDIDSVLQLSLSRFNCSMNLILCIYQLVYSTRLVQNIQFSSVKALLPEQRNHIAIINGYPLSYFYCQV